MDCPEADALAALHARPGLSATSLPPCAVGSESKSRAGSFCTSGSSRPVEGLVLPVVKGADNIEERAPALVSHWSGSGPWLCHVTQYHTLL